MTKVNSKFPTMLDHICSMAHTHVLSICIIIILTGVFGLHIDLCVVRSSIVTRVISMAWRQPPDCPNAITLVDVGLWTGTKLKKQSRAWPIHNACGVFTQYLHCFTGTVELGRRIRPSVVCCPLLPPIKWMTKSNGNWYKYCGLCRCCASMWIMNCQFPCLLWVMIADTVRYRYNKVSLLQNPHDKLPKARPWGCGVGCLLWG